MSSASNPSDAEKGIPEQEPFPSSLALSTQSFVSAPSSAPSDIKPPGLPAEGGSPRSSVLKEKIESKAVTVTTSAVAQKNPQPKKASRYTRFRLWFNTYRKFFTIVLTFNLIGILLAAINVWKYPRQYTSAFVLGNLFTAILMRNELFGRFLYLTVNTLFAKWTPLWFRLGCTSALQHLGGIHSGCATSGFLWLIFKVTLIFIQRQSNYTSVLVFGLGTNLIVAVSIASAVPWVRNTHHNVFEKHHRFAGWFGLASTWIFVLLGDAYDVNTHQWNFDGSWVVVQQCTWFATGMTLFALIPWLCIRKVKVEVEIPSPKVAVLRFERGMQQGLLSRISRSSIMEYHAFGIISEGTKSGEHYLICGVQGDFTRSLVEKPPKYIWTRQLKFAGVSNTSALYRRGIRVCTGTGLGAALSTCLQSPNWFLIWIGSDQEKTFGPTIAGLIHNKLNPDQYLLWDSKKMGGRPDVMKLIKDTYVSWNAEVIFITSNWQGNKEMMEGCKEAGIPAFGTLWDF